MTRTPTLPISYVPVAVLLCHETVRGDDTTLARLAARGAQLSRTGLLRATRHVRAWADPHGIQVRTLPGIGYYVPHDQRDRLRGLIRVTLDDLLRE